MVFLLVALVAACRKDAPLAPVAPPLVAAPVARIEVTAVRQVLSPGDTVRLTAQVFDAQGRVLPTATVTWSSGAANVARIDAEGLVTAVAEGTVIIDASAGGKVGQANLVVSVVELCECTRIIDSTQVTLQQRDDSTGVYVFRVVRGVPPPIDSGAIIVGAEDGGFLRRVVRRSTAGDRITLQTRIAYVEEAVRNGGFATTIDSPTDTVISQPGAAATRWGAWQTASVAAGAQLTARGLSLKDLKIAAKLGDDVAGTLAFTIKEGDIVFDPRVDIGASIGFFKLRQFHAIVGLDMGLNLDKYEVKVALAGAYKPDELKKLKKESVHFITRWRPFATFIGPMPLVGRVITNIKLEITPTITGSVAFSGKFRTGFGVSAGVRYDAIAGFSPTSSASSYFEATAPALSAVEASATIRVSLVPELMVELYGVGGPFVNLEPYAEATAKTAVGFKNFQYSALDWETFVGLGLNVNYGLRASLLGLIKLQAAVARPVIQPYRIVQAYSDGPLTVRTATVGPEHPFAYNLLLTPAFSPQSAAYGRNHETSTQTVAIAANGIAELQDIRSGPNFKHKLALSPVPGNCAGESLPRTVEVASDALILTGGAPTSVTLNVRCIATGALALGATTTGPDRPARLTATLLRLDTIGVGKATSPLTVQFPGTAAQADTVIDGLIPWNPANGANGELSVALRPDRRNCAVASPVSKVAVIQSADTVGTNFRISCVALGHVRFLTPIVDPDPAPISAPVQFTPLVVPDLARDSADRITTPPAPIVVGTPSTVSGLVPLYNATGATGRYRVSLSGGPNRCSGGGLARITAFPGDTAIADFPVRCVERLHVRTITTGPGADPDGYTVRVANPNGSDLTRSLGANTTMGIPGVSAGLHTIQLVDVDPSCVSPPAVTRTVSASDSILVVFQVSCPAPAGPAGLRATLIGTSRVDLAWTPVTSGPSIAFYRLYRDGALVDTTSATAFSNTNLTPFTSYSFQVSAVNSIGLEGAKSRLVVRTRDATPPSAPSGLLATPFSGTRIDLRWQASVDPETQIAAYVITRDGKEVGRSRLTTFSDLGLTPSTVYTYTVHAINGDSLQGAPSSPASASTLDVTPPTAPSGLSARAVSSSRIDLTWGAARDQESGIRVYQVYRNGTLRGTSPTLAFSDSLLPPSTSYTYTVRAVNGAGLQGAASQPAAATTHPDGSPPTAPSGLTAVAVSSARIDLTWAPASDPQSGITHYNIYRDGARVATAPTATFVDNGLTPSTTYVYEVAAVNGANLEGPRTLPASATTLRPPGTGDIRVVTTTIGNAPSDYLVRVTGSGVSLTQFTAPSATVTFPGLTPQAYTVELREIPSGCVVDGAGSRTATVTAGGVTQVNYVVRCS